MESTSILESMGKTPIISISKINKFCGTNVFLKLEKNNPGGSVKDRAAIFIVNEAEKKGYLGPGGTIIESSSGNFAISLAMIGATRGYHVIVLVDPKATSANIALMEAYGAEVIVVTEKDDTGSYHKTRISLANELARKIPGSYRPDQCFNILSAVAHYHSTAQEIYIQSGHSVDGIVCAVSTGGQVGGITEFFRRHLPACKIACVDAIGSSIFGGASHAYKTPGVGLGWTPRNIRDVNKLDYVYRIPDEAAYRAARILCRQEGILCGVSSGSVLLGALLFSRQLGSSRTVIAVMGDSGERYINTLFNDVWLNKNGIDINITLSSLEDILHEIPPAQVSPYIESNYRDDLIDILKVPPTTITHLDKYKII